MTGRTLRGRLLTSQFVVAAMACTSLVVGTLVAGGTIIRRNQDASLSSLADAVCSGIEHEYAEKRPELDMAGAAMHFFLEAHIAQHRFELWDRSPTLLTGMGEYSGLPDVEMQGDKVAQSCVSSVGQPDWESREHVLRLCTRHCGDFAIRIGAADILRSSPVRDVTLGLLVALPVALLLASGFGWVVAGRLLQPLRNLADATATMTVEPGMTLGVGAEPRELAQLESAFDALLKRVSDLLEREHRFASQASHELRTPLTQLRLRLERLRDSAGDASMTGEIDAALRSTLMLDRLTESLLMLARSEAGGLPLEPVNICDIVRGLSGEQDGLKKPVGVESTDDEILVSGNEELLTRAVANLIENAAKYAGRQASVTLRAFRSGDEAVIAVEDDGPGVPPDVRKSVLERFSRGADHRARIAGVGLGLSVVDAIVRRHGGRVEFGSGARGGECVRISLPVADEEAASR